MKYKLITDIDDSSFNKTINEYLKNGWELYGNTIVISATKHNVLSRQFIDSYNSVPDTALYPVFSQALIKRE